MLMSTALKNAILSGTSMKAALDGGHLFVYSGAIPATADAALNVASIHTELVEMTESGDGSTGLTFNSAGSGAMAKTTAEDWTGLIAFDGFVSGPGTQTPTFLRFCQSGDDGRAAATTQKRIQMTCGPSGQEIQCPDQVDNGANTQGFQTFEIRAIDIG